MNISIRAAAKKDIEQVLPFVRAYHKFEDINSTEKGRETAVRDLLANPELGGIWLIYSDNKVVGYIALCRGYSIEFEGFDGFIDEFYIAPTFRGKGLGRQTLESIKQEAKKMGIKALHLEVARDNERARKLYSDLEFEAREKYFLMSFTVNE